MPITDLLRRNASLYPNDTALVELNPEVTELHRTTWKEYELIERPLGRSFRREITWSVFNEKANRCANLLLSRGIGKGDKVAILMMNGIEWLPIYFGVLKTGALAVPLNFRYTAEEIRYCLELSDADALFFGYEFIGRIEEIADRIPRVKLLFYVGDGCPVFAESYSNLVSNESSLDPIIPITDDDYAAIYFSSGTTGFPKAILHKHRSLSHSAKGEQAHHGQTKD
ncbi:MAG: acyl--CoA ligase, partial [Clostridia bacterium]|nr:acyl--CoA ligase [Clostridia bacterium]